MTTAHPAFRSTARLVLVVAALLMVPLVAMQFTSDVAWSVSDFVVAGGLLLGAGLTYQLLASKAGNLAYRAGAALAVGSALFLVWANLAVGLIGSENNSANLMYLGVLAVGIVGAVLARLQARGMARTLAAMAVAQALVGIVALALDLGAGESRPVEIVGTTVMFVVLFAGSALLFRQAAQAQPRVRGT